MNVPLPSRSWWWCLLACAACTSTRGVYHSVALPADAAGFAPGVATSTWQDDANALVGFTDGKVTIASAWRDHTPSPAVIEASLRMQRELAETLRLRLPELPPLGRWTVEWVGIDADESMRQRVLREPLPDPLPESPPKR